MDLTAGLNDEQQAAVLHDAGPLLVLAGPGSGKTRVVTHRVAQLIVSGKAPAERILAVTFTNKAADEMKSRLQRLVAGRLPWACTFHSFCARILREYADRVGLTNRFSILDINDRGRVLADVLRDLEIDSTSLPVNKVEHRISMLKNDLTAPTDFEQQAIDYVDKLIARIYPAYQKRLREQNSVDFDDLLMLVAGLLRTDADFRQRLARRFHYIHVDEYQDTNLAQYVIAKGLACEHRNLCVTGDPDQSIYSWRGANIANILSFEEDFPQATVVRLEQNYRSLGNILRVADNLIRHNAVRKHKELRTDRDDGPRVTVSCHANDVAEAQAVADLIRAGCDNGDREYKDYAILLRTSSLSRTFEQAFRGRYIPYQVIGGFSFFERKEIRDLLAYARLVINPLDDAAFGRVVNWPTRGVGSTSLEKLRWYAREHGISMLAASRAVDRCSSIQKKQRATLAGFAKMIDDLNDVMTIGPGDALEQIADVAGVKAMFTHSDDDEDRERWQHLQDLFASAHTFASANPQADLVRFLETVSLVSDSDQRDGEVNKATIMTLHAAKGLEFPVVILGAFEKSILPHERSVQEGNEEEERRLAFVGITRAQEELHLTYTRWRMFQGRSATMLPSPFLAELPDDALDRQDVVEQFGASIHFQADVEYQEPVIDRTIPVVRQSRGASVADRFSQGMWVTHPKYGRGQILAIDGVGDERKAAIQFTAVGLKRFLLAKAMLEPYR